MPPEPLKVFVVPDEAPASAEAMGTKSKFWFSRSGEMWLYKATRPGSGEHWAEVLAAALAEMLGLPHARYELARWRDKGGVDNAGVVTRRFTPDGFDLVHGNELLAERDPNYPAAGARYVRTQEHTIDAVRGALAADVGLPLVATALECSANRPHRPSNFSTRAVNVPQPTAYPTDRASRRCRRGPLRARPAAPSPRAPSRDFGPP